MQEDRSHLNALFAQGKILAPETGAACARLRQAGQPAEPPNPRASGIWENTAGAPWEMAPSLEEGPQAGSRGQEANAKASILGCLIRKASVALTLRPEAICFFSGKRNCSLGKPGAGGHRFLSTCLGDTPLSAISLLNSSSQPRGY